VKAPEGLGPAGLAAWGRARRALDGHPDPDLLAEGAARYAFAVDLAHESRSAWLAEDAPLVVEYSNGMLAPSPLLRIIREAEHDAARFAVALGIDARIRRRAGRKPEAVIQPKVGISPAARLRAVKS
jgi:hypothetical protein